MEEIIHLLHQPPTSKLWDQWLHLILRYRTLSLYHVVSRSSTNCIFVYIFFFSADDALSSERYPSGWLAVGLLLQVVLSGLSVQLGSLVSDPVVLPGYHRAERRPEGPRPSRWSRRAEAMSLRHFQLGEMSFFFFGKHEMNLNKEIMPYFYHEACLHFLW